MPRNSRLSLELSALGHMAAEPDRMHKSSDIAAHGGSNPVVARRVHGPLRQAGLVASEKGPAGGWRLAHTPQSITLADVDLAPVERLLAVDAAEDSYDCTLEAALIDRVVGVMQGVEDARVQRLSETTIADLRKSPS